MARTKKRKLWLDYLAYLAVRLDRRVCPDALDRAVVRLGGFPGWVIYKVDKRHRQVGVDNLAAPLATSTPTAERDQIVPGSIATSA